MITTIFFDFDGVLTTDFSGGDTICRNLCTAIPSLDPQKVSGAYKKECRKILGGGKFTDVWDAFCMDVEQDIPVNVLEAALRDFPRNEAMFSLVKTLRTKYRTGMITDNFEERIALIDELHVLFDPLIVSATAHASKHDGTTKIFDLALEGAGCKADESLFIDNQERNLVTPRQMGMHTHLHDHAENNIPSLVIALENLGVQM